MVDVRLTSFTGKNSFEIQIRKRRLISISKDFLLKNEVRRAYYHTWEERIYSADYCLFSFSQNIVMQMLNVHFID